MDNPLRLEGDDAAGGPALLGQPNGMGADIRAHVESDAAWAKQLIEQRVLGFRELAVAIERHSGRACCK
jgi:hypothetical protein